MLALQPHPSTGKASFLRRVKTKIARCTRKVISHRSPRAPSLPPQFDAPIMETILAKLDLRERTKMRLVSRNVANLVDRMPVELPFLMFHSDQSGNYEMLSDEIDFVHGYLLSEISHKIRHLGDALSMDRETAVECLDIIVNRVCAIKHLWLDCADNGTMAKTVVSFFTDETNERRRKKFTIEQFTVIGTSQHDDFHWFSMVTLLARRTMTSLRFRHVKFSDADQSREFWSAVGECQKLTQLQYEPCRTDKWSRNDIVQAVENKCLSTLILTGIDGLCTTDLSKMCRKGCMSELSVVGEGLKPSDMVSRELKGTIKNLTNLLLQVDSWFSLDDVVERGCLLSLLRTLPITSTLEVVHILRGSAHETAKAVSYWMELASETNHYIKLKLDDVSQERLDSAVGRVLRKCRDVQKSEWTPSGMSLSMGLGRLLVLDRKTWFGDDE